MRVPHRRQQLRLLLQQAQPLGGGQLPAGQNRLQGDGAVQAEVVGQEHLAERAAAQQCADAKLSGERVGQRVGGASVGGRRSGFGGVQRVGEQSRRLAAQPAGGAQHNEKVVEQLPTMRHQGGVRQNFRVTPFAQFQAPPGVIEEVG